VLNCVGNEDKRTSANAGIQVKISNVGEGMAKYGRHGSGLRDASLVVSSATRELK
jgi:hypothetical protein